MTGRLLGAFLLIAATGVPTPRVTVVSALSKVRPDRAIPSGAVLSSGAAASARIRLARGECEAVQLVVDGGGAAVPALGAEVAPVKPAGPNAGAPPVVALFRVGFLEVKTPSNVEGAPGPWPDALVPAVDETAGEVRNAFPFDVPARRLQPLWVEACASAKTPPGRWHTRVALTSGGRLFAAVPLELQVERATIPPTSSLPNSFGLSGRSLLFGHHGARLDDAERLALTHRYARFALAHRLSLHAMSLRMPKVTLGDRLSVDFSEWDAEIAPYLEGTALPSGARFTAIDLRTPYEVPKERLGEYYRLVEAHFREKGWLDRLFAYVMDEPTPAQYPELRRRLEPFRAAPGLRRLVTMALDDRFEGLVTLWTPNLNCLVVRERDGELCAKHVGRERYGAREAKGDRLWWYLSCSSHGCGQGPFGRPDLDRYFKGWPSYVVDTDAAAARVMGWLAYLENVGGELHFDMVYAYNFYDRNKPDRRDPWEDQWAFGGNGDGTLLYPGRPDRIGGTTHVPVASIRLKLIRDGLEDYELLKLLAARGPKGEAEARRIARTLAPRIDAFERSPAAWTRARAALLDALASP